MARSTLSGYLSRFYNVELGTATEARGPATFIACGTPENNPELGRWVKRGLKLTERDLGDEGFQLLTHEDGDARCVVVYGKTPRALKHGCQELVFYRMSATTQGVSPDWPLNVVMKPEVAYRGIYMLPCWAAQDSLESWNRVLLFNSELTLNRVWFWLDGFPVAGHPGEYAGTALADARNVQGLIDLVNAEAMKIYVGGGWTTWHQEKPTGKDPRKAQEWYRAYLREFRDIHGFYLEPPGEGYEAKDWQTKAEALIGLIRSVQEERPGFEFAIAIGKFNHEGYLRRMAELDPRTVFWWWCWGDPLAPDRTKQYASLLRWHVNRAQSEYHGSLRPPGPEERKLAGVVTSYDPGMGFGNPWNGWGKLGVDKPRDFDPRTIPYFAHEYHFRERCWNPEMTEAKFVARLHRRLFDADAPPEAGARYRRLSQFVIEANEGRKPEEDSMAPIRAFAQEMRRRTWTPRTTDTLARMEEALAGLAGGGKK